MARVQDKVIVFRCALHCEYKSPLGVSLDTAICAKHQLDLRPVALLPGLLCSTCGRLSVDLGGGIACEGRDLGQLHSSQPMRTIWLRAESAGSRARLPDYPPEVEHP